MKYVLCLDGKKKTILIQKTTFFVKSSRKKIYKGGVLYNIFFGKASNDVLTPMLLYTFSSYVKKNERMHSHLKQHLTKVECNPDI